ncbi:cytochrome [Moniliophthora roreri]|uniref:Putative cytochrome P450 n=1 Tax=Moniliophthora roreri TaxID=221103 RepID=A0A0W0FHK9_MONRR|nr:cytochrome [Moniliophthora roreri]
MSNIQWPLTNYVISTSALALILAWIVSKILKIGRREAFLPPGPSTVPIFGNLHIFPMENPHLNWYMAFTAHIILTPKAIESHLPIQRAEASQTMYDLLKNPEDFFNHIGRYSNSVIMSVLFGKRCPRYESADAKAFFKSVEAFNRALAPSIPPVDLFPFLDYLPEKLAWWGARAKDVERMQRDLYFGLLNECEKRMQRGEHNGSYMEELIARQKELGLDRKIIGHLGGVLLEGGTETTASFLQRLVLFLAAFPDAQHRAQEEIDRVVGHERSPMLEDIKDIPYIQTVIKETHRFYPVTPLALPHAASADEEACTHSFNQSFIIPKGATIFVNTYAIYHNPDIFDDPEMFYPERYVKHEYGTKPGADC